MLNLQFGTPQNLKIFFVLRKKDNQISLLHFYHHSLMPIETWICVKFVVVKEEFDGHVFKKFEHKDDLCDGTRFTVRRMENNVLKCKISTGGKAAAMGKPFVTSKKIEAEM
ncbi:uncharacterized protein LOC142331040 isoform X2 [Lycorma delicatula]|uniref:uncharacterized protein LOC142331040 isoform X2 n=1 Tax=Lycorma delicatula TaxID=130591 RepID=UPI003F510C57